MIPTLPQSDSTEGRAARQAQLARAREEFRYDYTYMAPLPFAQTVPESHHPSVAWRLKLGETVITIFENTFDITRHASRWGNIELRIKILSAVDTRLTLQDQILNSILEGNLGGRARSLDDIKKMFIRIKRPPLTDDSQTDSFFAHMRVAGPNPMVIRRIDHLPSGFPVSDEQYQETMGAGDTLAAAAAEHRLYLADYAGLQGLPAGTFPNGQKYLAAPLALFAVPAAGSADRSLRAVAIQCAQQPGPGSPVFSPRDGLAWQVAKAFVQMADGNYHQAISHLGETHLVLEPIVLATCRQLAASHPLSVLLMPHFEGTLNINDAAQSNLMAPSGGVDRVMGGTIAASREVAIKAAQAFPFNHAAPGDALAARGVADTTALPGFPYRDDALLVWTAIQQWVSSYLRLYYASDADVAGDTELQAWIAEIVSPEGGRMKDIGEDGRIRTLDYLIRAVTQIIFIAGPQHAAVNFPQYPIMSFTPNMPLALYKAPPSSRDLTSENGLLDWLPPLDMIQIQMSLGYLLGHAQDTRLGVYAKTDHGSFKLWAAQSLEGLFGRGYFQDSRVAPLLAAFHESLLSVEDEITRRNQSRRPYEFLLPSRIPQSINV
ncbi:MAG: lipoxygenase [Vicinamibacteria bacterium]|nr:lipoxygenase [Vicinamibacteria bacterium]